MLIVLFIIILLIMVGSIAFVIKDDFDHDTLYGVSILVSLLSAIAFFVIILFIIDCGVKASSSIVIDKKISMYQEENKKIEKEITSVVNSYKDYEKEVISNAGEMATILIRFPELKSNELVNKQIQVYVDNNNKIKKLKEDKIDYSLAKWWLYFGK